MISYARALIKQVFLGFMIPSIPSQLRKAINSATATIY
jgi:hypothetical protein